jgi:hypothetical protein
MSKYVGAPMTNGRIDRDGRDDGRFLSSRLSKPITAAQAVH